MWEIGLVYGLILLAVWTPKGSVNAVAILAAAFFTVALSFRRYSANALGLAHPVRGALTVLSLGFVLLVGVVIVAGLATRFGAPQPFPWKTAWQYAIWSLIQQFILQSFIFLRLESLIGSRRAILVSSALFAIAHIPSPVLTPLTFLGALFFCEMFRRFRNIVPLGLVHAALGLTIASGFPDRVLHHMRVGIGYFTYHR